MGNKGFFKKHNKDDSPRDYVKEAQEEQEKHYEMLFEQTKGELPYKDMYGKVIFPNGREQQIIIIESLCDICPDLHSFNIKRTDFVSILKAYSYVYIFFNYDQPSTTLYEKLDDCGSVVQKYKKEIIGYSLCNLKNIYFRYRAINKPALEKEMYLFNEELLGHISYSEGVKHIDLTSLYVDYSDELLADGSRYKPFEIQKEPIEKFLSHLYTNDGQRLYWKFVDRFEDNVYKRQSKLEEYEAYLENGEKYTTIWVEPNSPKTSKLNYRGIRCLEGPYSFNSLDLDVNIENYLQGADIINNSPFVTELHTYISEEKKREKAAAGMRELSRRGVRVEIPDDFGMRKEYKSTDSVLEDLINYGFDNELLCSKSVFNRIKTDGVVKDIIKSQFNVQTRLNIIERCPGDNIEGYIDALVTSGCVGILIAQYYKTDYKDSGLKRIIDSPRNLDMIDSLPLRMITLGNSIIKGDFYIIYRTFRKLAYVCACYLPLCFSHEGIVLQMHNNMMAMAKLGIYMELHDLYPDNSKLLENDLQAIQEEYRDIFIMGAGQLSRAHIVSIIVNMMDAKQNLDNNSFEMVYDLYKKYIKETELRQYNKKSFYRECATIIQSFEDYAPYLLFDGKISENMTRELQSYILKCYKRGLKFDEIIEEDEIDMIFDKMDSDEFLEGVMDFAPQAREHAKKSVQSTNHKSSPSEEQSKTKQESKNTTQVSYSPLLSEIDGKLDVLKKLKELLDAGVLTEEEFKQKKEEILRAD